MQHPFGFAAMAYYVIFMISLVKGAADWNVMNNILLLVGISMSFEEVTVDGTIEVQVMDPDVVVGAEGEGELGPGSLAVETEDGPMSTVTSVIDISLEGSTDSSGEMEIVLPYDPEEIGSLNEGALEVLHYTGGEWVVEDDCTIDTTEHEITCTVDSID